MVGETERLGIQKGKDGGQEEKERQEDNDQQYVRERGKKTDINILRGVTKRIK